MRFHVRTSFVVALALGAVAGCGDDGRTGTGGGGGTGGSGGGSGGSTATSSGPGGGGGAGGSAEPTIDCSGDTILHYEFHNQIVGSVLDITAAGVLTHIEHDCCPPADHPIDEVPLPQQPLADLLAWIEAAGQGATHVEDGMLTAEGSLSGTLQVCTAEQAGVIVRDVARNSVAGGLDIVTVNEAPEGQQILDFVEGFVTQDMY